MDLAAFQTLHLGVILIYPRSLTPTLTSLSWVALCAISGYKPMITGGPTLGYLAHTKRWVVVVGERETIDCNVECHPLRSDPRGIRCKTAGPRYQY